MSVSSISSSGLSDYLSANSTTYTSEDLEALEEELKEAYAKKAAELTSSSSSSTDKLTLYGSLSAAAEDLPDEISSLASAVSSGDAETISSSLSSFASGYNSLITYLSNTGSAECTVMVNAMKKFFSEQKDALEAAGVSISSSGTLTIDSEKLAAADTSSLSDLFGSGSKLMKNISEYADTAAQVASLKTSGYKALQTMYGKNGTYSESGSITSLLNMLS